MYAQLGSIRFEGLKGFTSFSGTKAANYAEHALIEGKPRLQRVGTKLEELSVGISLHSQFCDPENEISKLEQAQENGEVLPLVLGNGLYVGDYVLQSVQRTVSHTDAKGNLVSATLQLSLKEFYDLNRLEGRHTRARRVAFATNVTAAPIRQSAAPRPSPAGSAANNIKAAALANDAIGNDVSRAVVAPEEKTFLAKRIVNNLNVISAHMERLRSTTELIDADDIMEGIPNATFAVDTAVQNMIAVMPAFNNTEVIARSEELSAQLRLLHSASSRLFSQVITRRL